MRYVYPLIALTVFAATATAVCAQPVARTATSSKAWKQPMTSWGDPDLRACGPAPA